MAVVFAVRGTSATAYFAGGRAGSASYGTTSIVSGAGTGIIGNSIINLDQTSFGQRSLCFDGRGNIPTGQKMSILIRMAPGDTSNALNLFYVGGNASNWGNQARLTGASQIASTFNQTPAGASILNQTAAWVYSAGTYYDVVYLIDGTLTTGAVKLYIDGSLNTTSNFSATRAALASDIGSLIAIGTQSAQSQNQTRIKVNEFVIWDTIIDPTSVACGGSNVSLNGSSRANFVDVTAFNGDSTDPGQANVRLSTTYVINGSSKTGTLDLPSVANVKTGVAYDNSSSTGTYDGSDRWTDPAIANVRSGTAYKANSTSNNRTGTAAIPVAANVRSGTATDATTGTLAVPAVGNVRSGASVDNTTGTLVVPSLANTKTGVAGDGGTGTYDGSDRWTDPGTTNVRSGTAYKANSTSNNETGSCVVPAAADVRSGVAVDATTGTLAGTRAGGFVG
jgi:hypothetical protein